MIGWPWETTVAPGEGFGKWTVETEAEPYASGGRRWWCVCSCGTERAVAQQSLIEGRSESCGHTRRTTQLALSIGDQRGHFRVVGEAGRSASRHRQITVEDTRTGEQEVVRVDSFLRKLRSKP